MTKTFKLSPEQLDILKEVGSICTGAATVALSQVLYKKIELQMPKLEIVPLEKLPAYIGKPHQPIVGIQMQVLGSIHGSALLIFTESNAFTLVDILVGKTPAAAKLLTEIGISALKELGNIIISAYLSTLGTLTKKPIFPSIPDFADGSVESILKFAFAELGGKEQIHILLIETVFAEAITNIKGNFFIAFDYRSLNLILTSIQKECRTKK